MRGTLAVAVSCLTLAGLAAAADATAAIRKPTEIPAQGLGPALTNLAKEFDFQVLYRTEIVSNLKSPGAMGALTSDEALGKVLKGTGLTYKYLDDKTVTIIPVAAANSGQSTSANAPGSPYDANASKEAGKKTSQDFRMAQVDQGKSAGLSSVTEQSSTSAANSAGPSGGLQEIPEVVVTAEKVSEDLTKVPMSISVLNAAQLKALRISDYADLTRAVPNLSFSNQGNPGGSNLEIRGVSSNAGASTVAIYLDEASITSRLSNNGNAHQPEPQLLDVQQVEVLRGPQGTLYGASAEGGLIKFHYNPVDLSQYDGYVTVEGADTSGGGPSYGVSGVLNAPLVNGIAGVRLAAGYSRDGGWIDRYSPEGERLDTNINDHTAEVARLSLDVQPTDQLSIQPTIFYQRLGYGSTDTVTLALGRQSTNDLVADGGSDTMIVPSLTVRYDLGGSELTSITEDYTRNSQFVRDGTVFNSVYIGDTLDAAPVLGLNGNADGATIAALPSPLFDSQFERQISQEFRISSKPYQEGGTPLTWVAGVYYNQTTERTSDNEVIDNFNNTFTTTYGVPTLDAIFGGPLPNNSIYDAAMGFQEKQTSAFTDVSYYPSPALRVSVGARYLEARDSEQTVAGGFFNGGPSNTGTLTTKDHATTPRLAVNYEFDERNSVYAAIGKGFRLGGPNNTFPTTFCEYKTPPPASYKHDNLWSYEAGVRTTSSAVDVSGSLFYIKWSQLQQTFSDPVCGFGYTANVGSARSYGAELALTLRPTSALTMGLTAGYTNATLTETVPQFGLQAGDRIEGVPTWSENSWAEYRTNLTSAVRGFLRANYNYTADSRGSLIATDPEFYRPAYGIAGASVGIAYGKVEWSLYAKNLFNDQKIIQTPDHASVPVGLTLRPRTIGISVMTKM